jgi:hypothetical protein
MTEEAGNLTLLERALALISSAADQGALPQEWLDQAEQWRDEFAEQLGGELQASKAPGPAAPTWFVRQVRMMLGAGSGGTMIANRFWRDPWLAGMRWLVSAEPAVRPASQDQASRMAAFLAGDGPLPLRTDPIATQLEYLWGKALDTANSADFRLFGEGMPHVDGGGRLDERLYVEVQGNVLRFVRAKVEQIVAAREAAAFARGQQTAVKTGTDIDA